jgi:hypothetical protein
MSLQLEEEVNDMEDQEQPQGEPVTQEPNTGGGTPTEGTPATDEQPGAEGAEAGGTTTEPLNGEGEPTEAEQATGDDDE